LIFGKSFLLGLGDVGEGLEVEHLGGGPRLGRRERRVSQRGRRRGEGRGLQEAASIHSEISSFDLGMSGRRLARVA